MILHVKHISKSFNGLTVLKDISFELESGSITSLFGGNGSGKTTLFHIIAGFLKPDTGKVFFNDKDLYGKSAIEIDQLGIGRVWQSPRVFKNLSVEDNLLLATKNHPGERILNYLFKPATIWQEEKERKAKAEKVLKEIGLAGKLQKTAGALSFGQQKLLSIGMLLMNEAELLLLDEPFAGVNGKMVDSISEVLLRLKESGKTILLVEHNRKKAREISDAVFQLIKGHIEAEVLTSE
ncbi:MAG: ATP-binding cassette domain-containing protein [Chitinophagales bacterium]